MTNPQTEAITTNGLSPYNRTIQIGIPACFLVLLTVLIIAVYDAEGFVPTVVVVGALYFILIALVVNGYRSKDILYDDDHVYLKASRNLVSVSFRNVMKIERTTSRVKILGVQFDQHILHYVDAQGRSSEVRFWISAASVALQEFKSKVKKRAGEDLEIV